MVVDERRQRLWRVIAAHADAPGAANWARGVCAACLSALPVDGAALTLRTKARAQEMLAASEAWSADLEQLQYTLGEGPAVAAFGDGEPVLVEDMRSEQDKWPTFADEAMRSAVRAMFAFPLRIGAIRLGTLDLYRRRPGMLQPPELTDAAVLADLAAVSVIEHADRVERGVEEWTRPDVSYQEVHVATGMLAARFRISLEDAFARLRGHAFAVGRPVVEIARDVIERRINADRLVE